MKILHVFPSDVFTGTVAHVLNLANGLTSEGHQVFLATDADSISDKFTSYQVPVIKRSLAQRFQNIRTLVQIVHDQNIDIIHSHSRAASWISYYAAKWTGIPQIATIHGRQHPRKRIIGKTDIYGSITVSVCLNLQNHLIDEIGLKPHKLRVIPNGLDFDLPKTGRKEKTDGEYTISVISRFNGAKGSNIFFLLENVFPHFLEKNKNLRIILAGGEWEKFPGKDQYEKLHTSFDARIKYVGFQNDIAKIISDSDLVIGSGRVAIESALLNTPVMVLGEACYYSILTKNNIDEAIASNFGDILPIKKTFTQDTDKIRKDLENFIENNSIVSDLSEFLQIYNLKSIVKELTEIYRKAFVGKHHPKHIPVLLYHKVTDDVIQTRHRTYVTRKNFEKQMFHLALRGKATITFREYSEMVNGKVKFPRKPVILTFDDGYADNYRNALPVMNRYNFKGVLFLMGNPDLTHNSWDKGEQPEHNMLLNSEEISKFIENGWEIGAHTVTHTDLTDDRNDSAHHEIEQSKYNLENTYRTQVISFAYPYGKTNGKVKALVKESGFEFGITTNSGGKVTIEDDRFEIFRANIYPKDNLFQFHKKISYWYRGYYKRTRGK